MCDTLDPFKYFLRTAFGSLTLFPFSTSEVDFSAAFMGTRCSDVLEFLVWLPFITLSSEGFVWRPGSLVWFLCIVISF